MRKTLTIITFFVGSMGMIKPQPSNTNKPIAPLICISKITLPKNPLEQHIENEAKNNKVSIFLVKAMIKQESMWKKGAKSSKGAIGYMQLMPATAKELGVNPYNEFENISGGIKYMAKQMKTFKGNTILALAAYNAGAGNVLKYGGIPPFKETKKYVSKIMLDYTLALS